MITITEAFSQIWEQTKGPGFDDYFRGRLLKIQSFQDCSSKKKALHSLLQEYGKTLFVCNKCGAFSTNMKPCSVCQDTINFLCGE